MNKKIIFTAGGTGGHIFPALSIAKLCQDSYDVLWVGAKGGVENTIVPRHGIRMHNINVLALRKKGLVRSFLRLFVLFRAFIQAFIIILRERPDVIVGFGGYVTFPMCFMGAVLRIPVVIHEQNSLAGLSNRFLFYFVNKVIVAYPDVLKSQKTLLLGNPVRDDISNISMPESRYQSRTGGLNILILGGSLGANIFNEILPDVLSQVKAKLPSHISQITHQVGRGNALEVSKKYKNFGIIDANVVNFIDDMAMMYATCDLLICRSGASTVSEVCASGVAAIFVPYPHAVDDHQRYNVANLQASNAAIMFIQSQLTIDKLVDTIITLDRSKCEDMAKRARALAIKNSSENIKQLITNLIV